MTVGKRPRLMMRRTVSVASLGAGSEHAASKADHEFEHQVIGFTLDSSAAAAAAATTAAAAGSKSRPFSGFSHLIADAAPAVASDKVGLGILAALEAPPSGTILRSMAPPHLHQQQQQLSNGAYDFSRLMSSGKQQQQQQHASSEIRPHSNVDFIFHGSNSNSRHHHHNDHYRGIRSTLDFLEACFLCKRDIAHGDIYMYRGDRAFCSAECRQQQILTDERVERRQPKCSSAALKQIGGSNQQSRHVNQRAKVAPATTAAAA